MSNFEKQAEEGLRRLNRRRRMDSVVLGGGGENMEETAGVVSDNLTMTGKVIEGLPKDPIYFIKTVTGGKPKEVKGTKRERVSAQGEGIDWRAYSSVLGCWLDQEQALLEQIGDGTPNDDQEGRLSIIRFQI